MTAPFCGDAFFLPSRSGTGQRFCLFHRAPAGVPARGALVYVHPLAEEMNRSRRMAALQARAMAEAGYAVLQIDLYGCGDSSGDFGDASWTNWIEDVLLACAWLRQRIDAPLWIWGLRAGALLAAEAARRDNTVTGLLFWQPVFSGKQHLEQFLRLQSVREKLAGETRNPTQKGAPREVAGYTLAPGLMDALARAELILPERPLWVECLEISGAENPGLSPALSAWLARPPPVFAGGRAVHGPAFWQTPEIAEAPELLAATLAAMHGWKAYSR